MTDERKNFIKRTVLDCLTKANLNTLPLPIEDIILSFPFIRIVEYSQFMQDFQLTISDVIRWLGSDDACSNYKPKTGQALIFFNDYNSRIIVSNRYRWSLAHELGHILLKHHTDERTRIFRNGLSNEEYKKLEEEADYFAQLILVPHACLVHFVITKPKHLMLMCKISYQAATIRYRDFVIWRSHLKHDEYDSAISNLFYDFSFKKKCKNCKHVVIQRLGRHCIFCGKKQLEWSSEKEMIYDSLPTYSNSKLVKCPICKNEITDIEGFYCQICGTYLQNQCTNFDCTTDVLPTNARYCPVCGCDSTFKRDGILKNWNENLNTTFIEGDYLNIPDGFEEDLPFN